MILPILESIYTLPTQLRKEYVVLFVHRLLTLIRLDVIPVLNTVPSLFTKARQDKTNEAQLGHHRHFSEPFHATLPPETALNQKTAIQTKLFYEQYGRHRQRWRVYGLRI